MFGYDESVIILKQISCVGYVLNILGTDYRGRRSRSLKILYIIADAGPLASKKQSLATQ